MAYYSTVGEFQNHMKNYYELSHTKVQFIEMVNFLYRNRMLKESLPSINYKDLYGDMSDEDFEELVYQSPLILDIPEMYTSEEVTEKDIIPSSKDVFILTHMRYTSHKMHNHNYFEINYVFRGECTFYFEKSSRKLCEGELCIIAPHSKHDIVIEDDTSFVFNILIRKSTFNTTFFSLLSQRDLLSYFFRTLLHDSSHSNYLLFFVKNTAPIKSIIKNLAMENYRNDTYSNNCCISYVNLLFSLLLRNYSETIQFYDYKIDSDFSLILQYIQHNYKNLTLSALGELFHYSEPYLSTMIKHNTGCTFSDLVKKLRMSDAVDYLTNTNMKIAEIAELTGYNSSDHFSRVFRNYYHISPQEYRKDKKELNIR
jgi:AraC-like DNA-binding protein/mannose-6-phosphate isomerase-like protein (cupin superfamily)